MNVRRIVIGILFVIVTIAGLGVQPILAQTTDQQPTPAAKKVDETNLDTQLYLIVGHNQNVEEAKLPAALEPVLKQLRASLPFKNYRVSATLINRVKNDGRLNLKWIGGPLILSPAASNQPNFYEFRVNNVRLFREETGQQFVRLEGFGFSARIPIQSLTGIASAGQPPIINYEPTGLNTDISMREGEPVIVGTLNVGPSGDAIILVMSAKRTAK